MTAESQAWDSRSWTSADGSELQPKLHPAGPAEHTSAQSR